MNRRTYPENDGYYLPFEGDKHQRTFILMPFRLDTWRNGAKPGQNNFFEVISAVAEHEEVVVGIHPSHYRKLAPMFQGMNNVKPISIRYNDSWARDNMPLFVTNEKNVRSVDFRFNSWGGDFDGLYANYRDDDKLSGIISKRMKVPSYRHPTFILEGGSIHVDGEGTLLTTEACLLSKGRNPHMTKKQIEKKLCDYLNLKKIIWIKDGIDPAETNGHIDDVACFIRPGEVACIYTEDKNHPFYQQAQDAYKTLSNATDAKGRKLKVWKLCLTQKPCHLKGAKTIDSVEGTIPREDGEVSIASYMNFLIVNGGVIVPQYGDKNDKLALQQVAKMFPERKVVGVKTWEVAYGGGNIHCITQQQPK